MNKKLILSLIGVVVVVAGVVFFMRDRKQGGTDVEQYSNQETSLKELLASGSPQKCTFQHGTDRDESSGEVYIANGKMRGNFVSRSQGQTIMSHMIVEGTTGYVWTDQMNQGFMMSMDSMMSGQVEQSKSVDINQRLAYSCNPWDEEAGMFVRPQGIVFSDIKTMMQGSAGTSAGTGTQCSACDQAPNEAAKAQCKIALGCK